MVLRQVGTVAGHDHSHAMHVLRLSILCDWLICKTWPDDCSVGLVGMRTGRQQVETSKQGGAGGGGLTCRVFCSSATWAVKISRASARLLPNLIRFLVA